MQTVQSPPTPYPNVDAASELTAACHLDENSVSISLALNKYFQNTRSMAQEEVEAGNIASCAFFFDIDGTLSDIAATPEGAFIAPDLLASLHALDRAGIPVALVSGRSLSSIDRMTAPYIFTAAGQHGLELRIPDKEWNVATPQNRLLFLRLGKEVEEFAHAYPGLIVENKGMSIAVHYRNVSELETRVADKMARIVSAHTDCLMLQEGKMVKEIRLKGMNKGEAILSFMNLDAFAGKTPLFFGDDMTDEDGFAAVNGLGGISIKVGTGSTLAQYYADTPSQVKEWLQAVENGVDNSNIGEKQ